MIEKLHADDSKNKQPTRSAESAAILSGPAWMTLRRF